MDKRLERILPRVQKPARYVGGEYNANDIPMLRLAHIPFAPANAIAPVRQVPGIRVLPDCRENALAEMIRQLGELY